MADDESKEISKEELQTKCLDIINNWCKLHKDKNISISSLRIWGDGIITLKQKNKFTHYNTRTKKMSGFDNKVSEDLRDYLRREGIKIYTDKSFESIKPEWL